ncbi:hemagglutinin repeat-containing protein [Variovorax sp. VNK109]|uniref:hemagglutinin repeat-containing protein n=1 Tax=Variovorax sp. VNK109 TaxID=3400919 RepID=UPI003C024E94
MNRNIHRVIFSAARGERMVVSEVAKTAGGAGSGETVEPTSGGIRSALLAGCIALSGIAGAVLLAFNPLFIASAQAQIIADPSAPGNQRPIVLAASNGVPVVNIQTPSAAGVSRNTYRQFDVNRQGVILNNSRTNTSTKLGGWIAANPSLATGSARVILNEINSSNPSQLKGWVEVGGARAEVIVANPAGIQVDGAGFINASGVTLATGTPVMNAGNLESFRVTGGRVNVEGLGLDTRDADYTAILARAMQVNASIWAKELKVVTGANEVKAGAASTSGAPQATPIAATGEKPAFALDVAALGGMYAGKIFLIGTEAGLGVNNAGQIGSMGDLVLLNDGQLVNRNTIQAQGHVSVQATGIDNAGGVMASLEQGLSIDSRGAALNNASGQLWSERALTIDAGGVDNRLGVIQARGDIDASASAIDNTSGAIETQASMRLQVAGGIGNTAGSIAAEKIAQIQAAGLVAAADPAGEGRIAAGEQLELGIASGLVNRQEIRSGGDLNLRIDGGLTNQGAVLAGGNLVIAAKALDNTLTGEIVGGNASLQMAGDAINRGLIDGGTVHVDAATLINSGTGRIYGDHLMIEAQQVSNVAETVAGVSSTATMAARDRLDIGAQDLLNAGGSLLFSAGDIAIGGTLNDQGYATGAATTVTNRASTIEALGSVSIAALQLNNLNEGFSTRVDTSNESVAEHYIRLGGTLYLPGELGNCFKCASDRYDAGIDHWRLEYVAPSSRYPFEAGYSRVPYQLTQIAGYQEVELEAGTMLYPVYKPYEYAATDPVWTLFGVPAGQHEQLVARLKDYNADLMNRAYRDFDHVWISSRQTVQTGVDNPGVAGRILSGGHMRLAGGLVLNDNSQIIAGGTLDISGSTLTNTETPGERTVTDFGTLRRDTVSYDPYGPREGYYGWGSYVGVREHVTTRLDTSQVLTQTNATGTTSVQVRTSVPTPGTAIPGAPQGLPSLYRQAGDSSSGYLIETDPRFADYRQWLASDYLLAALSYDPVTLHKRLGDGFYEQRLIREQVGQLTGQRFLDGYASDEAQYRALMEAGVTYAKAWNLIPGVALTAQQMAQLTSDIVWLVAEDVTLPDGTRTTALVPRVYVRAKEGDLTASGALLAGRNVNIELSGDLTNQGTVAGRRVVNLSANNVNNLGGHIQGEAVVITAAQDVNNIGGAVQAGSYLDVYAGRNLNVQSTTSTAAASAGRSSSSLTQVDRVAGLYVSDPAGVLIASAGQDVNVIGGVLASNGDMAVMAGRDINLGTVTTATSQDLTADDRNYIRESSTREVGSQIVAGGSVYLDAGRDVNARAAQVDAKEDLVVSAERDIRITEGRATSRSDDARYANESSGLSSWTTEMRNQGTGDTSVASEFGGSTVTMVSGGDTTIRGSNVVSDQGTTVVAGENLSIEAATDSTTSSSFSRTSQSGVFASGNSITLGSRMQSTDQQGSGTYAAASTVGAITGNVNLIAGQNYTQTGSDVLSPGGDINIAARNVAITEARETSTTTTVQKFKQSGVSVSVGSPILSAAQTVDSMAQAAGNTGSSRMQALAGGAAALNLYNNASEITGAANALASGDFDDAGSVTFSVGSSRSQSTTTQTSNTARGSNVAAGGNVSITARGAGAGSDILVQGSDITAGHNAMLSAEGDVDLQAAQNNANLSGSSSSSSASVGVSFGAQNGVTVAASRGRGNEAGNDTWYDNTHVSAGNTVVIESGADTTLSGALVSANQVQANVGGNLSIQSLQDTSTYQSRSSNSGGSITFSPAGVPTGASLSAGRSNIDSAYASVNERSGIEAGDGGFQISVANNTALTGGVIASTQQAVDQGNNSFTTGGSLTTNDIQNTASYEGNAASVSGGVGQQANGSYGLNGFGAGVGEDSGNASSVTTAGISGVAGDTSVRTGDAKSGIDPIFDKDKVQKEIDAQVTITAEFGRQASSAWGTYANRRFAEATTEEERKCWAPDGACRAGGHAVVGGLSGGLGGAAAAGLSSTAAPHVQAFLIDQGIPAPAAQALTQLSAVGLGASVGGTAGAAAGFNEASNNAVMAIPLLVEAVVAGGVAAARMCLMSPACLNTLKLGGAAMVAKVASVLTPEDLAQIPGFGAGTQPVANGPLGTPDPGPGGITLTPSPATPPGSDSPNHTGGNQIGEAPEGNNTTISPTPVQQGPGIMMAVPPGDRSAIEDALTGAMGGMPTVTRPGTTQISEYPQGTQADAEQVFHSLPLSGVHSIDSDYGNWGQSGTLPDGTTVTVRPSQDGRPTIEVIDRNRLRGERKVREIRFGTKP